MTQEQRPVREGSRTREAILAAAISLYRHEGYGAVTMRAIAKQLGFSAPAIYNHFLSKEEIFLTLQERGLEMLADAVLTPATEDALEDLRSIFVRYYQFSRAHREYFTLMYVDPSTPRLSAKVEPLTRMTDETNHRIRRCVDEGIFPPEAIPLASGLLWSMVHGTAVLGQLQEQVSSHDVEQFAGAGLDMLLQAIRGGLLPANASIPQSGD